MIVEEEIYIIAGLSDNIITEFEESAGSLIPLEFSLYSSYPNPFNPTTTINFRLPVDIYVDISVYNIQGVKVASLINGAYSSGYHSTIWNATSYPSGVYFVKMITREFTSTQKLMLVK